MNEHEVEERLQALALSLPPLSQAGPDLPPVPLAESDRDYPMFPRYDPPEAEPGLSAAITQPDPVVDPGLYQPMFPQYSPPPPDEEHIPPPPEPGEYIRPPRPRRHPHRRVNRLRSLRRWRLFLILMVLIPVTIAVIMVALHGPAFFVFRAAGTGESPDFPGSSALAENQGPGQPDAPRAHPVVQQRAHPPVIAVRVVAVNGSTRLTLPAARHYTWAGIAELRTGRWVILDAGTSQARVAACTGRSWAAHLSRYMSGWIVVPVKE